MAAGVLTILISAWGTLIPFVEPMFGFHATGTPSLHWNAAHTLLAVVPGVIGVAMGFVVLWAASQAVVGRTQTTLAWAGLITILSGAWFIIGPKAWSVITTHGVYFAPALPAQRLGVSNWICPWYWSPIDRVWRIRSGVGVSSSNQRSCRGGQRRGIGTKRPSPGTSRAQNSVGTSGSVGCLSFVDI